MSHARPRNEEDGTAVRRGAVPGARVFHPFMRDVSPQVPLPAVPDSHTTKRRAGNPEAAIRDTFLSETYNRWKQYLRHRTTLNYSPPSFMNYAIRWRRSRLRSAFSATMSTTPQTARRRTRQ